MDTGFINPNVKASNGGESILVRTVDFPIKEIGIMVGAKTAIYVYAKNVDKLIEALQQAKVRLDALPN